MIKFIIRILVLFRPLFTRIGIDFNQMASIVSAKLTVSNRLEKNRAQKTDSNNVMFKQGVIMSISGLCIFYFTMTKGTLPNTLLFFHAFLVFMVFMNFLTEYSQFLFNNSDNEILQRLPVNSRTILAARIVSMLTSIFFATFCLIILPFLIIVFWQGVLAGISFIISIIFNTIFSLLFANLFYVAALRSIPAQKFQKVITYTQIIFVAFIVIGYQFISSVNTQLVVDFSLHTPVWMYFTPPCYFMAMTELMLHPTLNASILAGIGVVSCLLLFILNIIGFGSSFTSKISQVEQSMAGNKPKNKEKTMSFLSGLFTRHPLQNSGFTLTWRLINDNLKFKQAVIPTFIWIIVPNLLAIYHIFKRGQLEHFTFATILSLYILPLLLTAIVPILGLNDKNNMLWIYQSKPLPKPGLFLLGCFKAIYIKYFFPIFLLFFILYLGIFGTKAIADLLLVFSLSTLFAITYFWIAGMLFPFSKEQNIPQSYFFKVFPIIVFLGIIALLHFLITFIPYANIIALPLCWGVIVLIARKIINVRWKRIEAQY